MITQMAHKTSNDNRVQNHGRANRTRTISITVIGYLRSFQNINLETNNEIRINKLITTEDKLQTF